VSRTYVLDIKRAYNPEVKNTPHLASAEMARTISAMAQGAGWKGATPVFFILGFLGILRIHNTSSGYSASRMDRTIRHG
jgi:hypothetical protein